MGMSEHKDGVDLKVEHGEFDGCADAVEPRRFLERRGKVGDVADDEEFTRAGVDGLPVTMFLVGLVVSAVVGYVTVKYFIRYLAGHSLHGFAAYRLVLAAGTLVWLAINGG